jgi:hypothetical protein
MIIPENFTLKIRFGSEGFGASFSFKSDCAALAEPHLISQYYAQSRNKQSAMC